MKSEMVKKAVLIFSDNINLDRLELIGVLEREFGKDGKKLYYFMPIAFGWIIFSRLGATDFSKTIRTDGIIFPIIDVKKDKIFSSLLKFAESEMTNCFQEVSKESFEKILYFGAEGKLAKKFFKEGKNLAGSRIEEPYVKDSLD